MKKVSVSELKARLSYYLRQVGRGSEILVLRRGVPVAKLTQPGALAQPPMELGTSLSEALHAERDERV